LLERARAGEASAFDSLCGWLRPPLLRYVNSRMRSDERRWVDADDVVQLVLVELQEKLDTLPDGADEDHLRGWLFRRAVWRLTDLARQQRSRRQSETELPEADEPAKGGSRDGTVTREDTSRLVRQLVDHLPGEYADIVRLCSLEGDTFVAAGRKLGLKEDTVRRRFERACEILEKRLGELGKD